MFCIMITLSSYSSRTNLVSKRITLFSFGLHLACIFQNHKHYTKISSYKFIPGSELIYFNIWLSHFSDFLYNFISLRLTPGVFLQGYARGQFKTFWKNIVRISFLIKWCYLFCSLWSRKRATIYSTICYYTVTN